MVEIGLIHSVRDQDGLVELRYPHQRTEMPPYRAEVLCNAGCGTFQLSRG